MTIPSCVFFIQKTYMDKKALFARIQFHRLSAFNILFSVILHNSYHLHTYIHTYVCMNVCRYLYWNMDPKTWPEAISIPIVVLFQLNIKKKMCSVLSGKVSIDVFPKIGIQSIMS